jgi:hypothetical protein
MSISQATSILIWSLVISVPVTLASVLGLVESSVYEEETKNWATQAKGQDLGNLLAVVTLLLSGHGYNNGSHRAALIWLGSLFYLVYAYVVYSMAVHFDQLFLVYVAVLGLSAYAVMFSVARLRITDVAYPAPREGRFAGCTAVAIGVLFGALWLSELVPATLSGEVPPSVLEAGLWVNPVHVIDLAILLPALVIVGVQTLRRRPEGQFFVAPLLVFSVLMGTSIVSAMVVMTVDGFDDTLPPLVMVTLVVLVSLVAAWRYLGGYATGTFSPDRTDPLGSRSS